MNGGNEGSSISCNREVGSGHTEAIDGVGNIVDSLKESIGINILVAATGHSKCVSRFSPGLVD